jgi:hypothetical protein
MNHGDIVDLRTPEGRATARRHGLPVPGEDVPAGADRDGGSGQEAPPGGLTSEKEFQAKVIAEAKKRGWKCYHVHFSQASEAGFPDWVFVRERVVFAELKSEQGRLTKDQKAWYHALLNAGAEAHVWRPSDWQLVVETLMRRTDDATQRPQGTQGVPAAVSAAQLREEGRSPPKR